MNTSKSWILFSQAAILAVALLFAALPSAWATQNAAPASIVFAPAPVETKDPGVRPPHSYLDEGCLPPDSFTIMLNATLDHSVLNFYAGQIGTYRVYSTTDPTNAIDPPGAGWNAVGSVAVNIPGHQAITDPSALVPYTRYAATHTCPLPSNNSCANATTVTAGTYYFSTIGATTDGPDEPAQCNYAGNSQVGQDIWYLYVATCTGPLTISLCGSNYDTKLAVYSGSTCPTSASAIACNDDYCGFQSLVTLNVFTGFSYLIRVGGYANQSGTGVMTIAPGVSNDDCANAISVGNGATNFNTRCATTDGPSESFGGSFGVITDDIWYLYTATNCGPTIFSLCGSSYDTRLGLYGSATCPTLAGTALAVSDDDCGLQSQITYNTTAGVTYLVRVGGYNNAVGTGTLTITPSTAPANDLCANAISISSQNGHHTFSTLTACTDGPDGPLSCHPTNDVWFVTQVGACGSLQIDVCNSDFDTELQVFHTNDCNNLGTPIACNDDTSACPNSTRSMVVFDTPDQGPYYIRVGGYNGARGTGEIVVNASVLFWANDACSGAFPLDYGTFAFSNHCAGTDGDSTTCGQIYRDVWFTIPAILHSTTTVSLCGSNFNTKMAVYYTALSGCGSISPVTCNDDFCGQQSQVSFTRNLVFGTYFLRVGGAGPLDEGHGTITITNNP